MSACCSKNWNPGSDQVLLMNFFVMACHHNCSGVIVKVFLEFQLAICGHMLWLIRMSIKQFIDCQAGMVGFSTGCFWSILFIQWCCSELGAAMAFNFNPSWECDGRKRLWQLHHASSLGVDFVLWCKRMACVVDAAGWSPLLWLLCQSWHGVHQRCGGNQG